MRIWALCVAACAVVFSPGAKADDYAFVVHGFSHHFQSAAPGKQWNEVHPGIGMRIIHDKDVSVQLSYVHQNSSYNKSVYALVDYTPLRLGWLYAGGFAGLATGYEYPLQPIGGLVLRLETPDIHFTARYAPRMARQCCPRESSSVATIEISIPF